MRIEDLFNEAIDKKEEEEEQTSSKSDVISGEEFEEDSGYAKSQEELDKEVATLSAESEQNRNQEKDVTIDSLFSEAIGEREDYLGEGSTMGTGEVVAKEFGVGFYDYAKAFGIESQTFENYKDQLDDFYRTNPSQLENIALEMNRYWSDAVAFALTRGTLSKFKAGKELVDTYAKMAKSSNPRTKAIAWGTIIAAEEEVSNMVHDENYTVGEGAAIGGAIGGAAGYGSGKLGKLTAAGAIALNKIFKKHKDNLLDAEVFEKAMSNRPDFNAETPKPSTSTKALPQDPKDINTQDKGMYYTDDELNEELGIQQRDAETEDMIDDVIGNEGGMPDQSGSYQTVGDIDEAKIAELEDLRKFFSQKKQDFRKQFMSLDKEGKNTFIDNFAKYADIALPDMEGSKLSAKQREKSIADLNKRIESYTNQIKTATNPTKRKEISSKIVQAKKDLKTAQYDLETFNKNNQDFINKLMSDDVVLDEYRQTAVNKINDQISMAKQQKIETGIDRTKPDGSKPTTPKEYISQNEYERIKSGESIYSPEQNDLYKKGLETTNPAVVEKLTKTIEQKYGKLGAAHFKKGLADGQTLRENKAAEIEARNAGNAAKAEELSKAWKKTAEKLARERKIDLTDDLYSFDTILSTPAKKTDAERIKDAKKREAGKPEAGVKPKGTKAKRTPKKKEPVDTTTPFDDLPEAEMPKKKPEDKTQKAKRMKPEELKDNFDFTAKEKAFIDKILALRGKDGVLIKDVFFANLGKDGEFIGAWFPKDGGIVINLDRIPKNKRIEEILIHELVHGVTHHTIRNNPRLQRELDDIFDKASGEPGAKGRWIENTDEMLSEFFSYPNAKDFLENTDMPNKLIRQIENFIRRLIGMEELPTKVGDRLKSFLDDIESGATKDYRDVVQKSRDFLIENKIFKFNKDGTIEVGGYQTDAFQVILNDLGLSNKKIVQKIKDLRKKNLGNRKQINEISKSIARAIEEAPESAELISKIIAGRVASVITKFPLEKIKSVTVEGVAKQYNLDPAEIKKIVEQFGQAGIGKDFHYKNTDELLAQYKKVGVDLDQNFADAIEILVAKREFDFNSKLPSEGLIKTLADIEAMEDALIKSRKMHGYAGFVGQHEFDVHVAVSKAEIEKYKEDKGWRQVGDTNTFYRKNLEADVSDGILPSTKKVLQGVRITDNIEANMKRMKEEGIEFTPIRQGRKIVALRVYPAKETADVLGYSKDPAKLMARKYRLLAETAIRDSISKNLDKDIKAQFSTTPKKGFVEVDKDLAGAYRKAFGVKGNEKLYVKKDLADLLVGVKETRIFDPYERNGILGSRLGRTMEIAYKDLFKRMKRTVTAKSPSSIVNNYIVSFSMLKMAGVPYKEIPGRIRQAHKDYSEFMDEMEKYYKVRQNSGKEAADKFLQGLRKRNIIAEMMANGDIQSAVDDSIIQMDNEADMFQYWFDSVFGFKQTNTDKIINEIELKPDSKVGRFFLNKFVMADIIGRASMYTYLRKTKGMSAYDAGKQTTDLFVDFSAPMPESIRVLEEYGVPFIGWMYRVQLPLFKLMKDNPKDAASVVAAYYMLQAIFDDEKDSMQDGYAGDLKIDSWFFHNSFADTGVFSQSPALSLEFPNVKPQIYNEIQGAVEGKRSPLEILGLNIKTWSTKRSSDSSE